MLFRQISILAPVLALAAALLSTGCATVTLLPDGTRPYQEVVLEGEAAPKVALVHVRGFISTAPNDGLLRDTPSLVQRTVSQLDRAAADPDVKALVLAIDSPGGTATGSQVLHAEILRFKAERKTPVIACQMEAAASGGYYASAAADWIVAHPTTITGSVGTIFVRPKVDGLLEKIGADVEITKSGDLKDMGSPFRETKPGERERFRAIVADLNTNFLAAVAESRQLNDGTMAQVSQAAVYTGTQAKELGLVDQLGTLRDALAAAKERAGLPEDARVVTYRVNPPGNDNLYNPVSGTSAGLPLTAPVVDLGPAARLLSLPAGFYHLWLPEAH